MSAPPPTSQVVRGPHPRLGLRHGTAWLAAPADPRQWPLGPSHLDAHLPWPGVLATRGWHRARAGPMGSDPGGTRSFSQTHLRLRSGEEESLTAALLSLYKPFRLQKLGPADDQCSTSLACLPSALLVAGHQRPRGPEEPRLLSSMLRPFVGERERVVCGTVPCPLSPPPSPQPSRSVPNPGHCSGVTLQRTLL